MPYPRLRGIALLTLLFLAPTVVHAQVPRDSLRYRWVYAAYNLQVDANVAVVQGLLQRAATAGYNGMVLADYKLQILDAVPQRYFANVAAVQATARQLGIDIYPTVCLVGYAGGILSHDPNIIEAQPVRLALFTAHTGQADITPEPSIALANGDFESATNNHFAGWNYQDNPGQSSFADRQVFHSGQQSIRMESIGIVNPPSGNCRVIQRVNVSPWRQYHVWAWIKTNGFDRPGEVRIQAINTQGRSLMFYSLGVSGTQDWMRYDAVFNSQASTQVNVYLGVWGGNVGQLWFDDAGIEEVGLLNVVRRPGCPLTVTSENGAVTYREDFDFQPVSDPRMGTVPWPGSYEVYHAPPTIRLTPNSAIVEGQHLRVSFFHAIITDSDKAACCLSEPAVYVLLQNEINRVESLLHPKGFFFAHDEIRVADWCDACRARALTPGELLADNIARCEAMVPGGAMGAGGPGARSIARFVWSDMFDPFHNAVDNYYLVNGSWAGSFKGLSAGTVIVNWNSGNRLQSMPFFAGRGFEQVLAGYYDGAPDSIRAWLADAQTMPDRARVVGVMYTTWANRYTDLEAFAHAAWTP